MNKQNYTLIENYMLSCMEDSAFCPKCGAKMEVKTEETYFDEEDASDVVVSEIVEDVAEAVEEVVEDADFVEITE